MLQACPTRFLAHKTSVIFSVCIFACCHNCARTCRCCWRWRERLVDLELGLSLRRTRCATLLGRLYHRFRRRRRPAVGPWRRRQARCVHDLWRVLLFSSFICSKIPRCVFSHHLMVIWSASFGECRRSFISCEVFVSTFVIRVDFVWRHGFRLCIFYDI